MPLVRTPSASTASRPRSIAIASPDLSTNSDGTSLKSRKPLGRLSVLLSHLPLGRRRVNDPPRTPSPVPKPPTPTLPLAARAISEGQPRRFGFIRGLIPGGGRRPPTRSYSTDDATSFSPPSSPSAFPSPPPSAPLPINGHTASFQITPRVLAVPSRKILTRQEMEQVELLPKQSPPDASSSQEGHDDVDEELNPPRPLASYNTFGNMMHNANSSRTTFGMGSSSHLNASSAATFGMPSRTSLKLLTPETEYEASPIGFSSDDGATPTRRHPESSFSRSFTSVDRLDSLGGAGLPSSLPSSSYHAPSPKSTLSSDTSPNAPPSLGIPNSSPSALRTRTSKRSLHSLRRGSSPTREPSIMSSVYPPLPRRPPSLSDIRSGGPSSSVPMSRSGSGYSTTTEFVEEPRELSPNWSAGEAMVVSEEFEEDDTLVVSSPHRTIRGKRSSRLDNTVTQKYRSNSTSSTSTTVPSTTAPPFRVKAARSTPSLTAHPTPTPIPTVPTLTPHPKRSLSSLQIQPSRR